jgi:putative ABC transport system ATP-binding protein
MNKIIKLKNIYKIYKHNHSELTVLRNITFDISAGEYISIAGASGSGKTTLMNILGCLDKATKGNYYFNGKDITSLNDKQLSKIRAEKIGFVFQSFNLLPNYNVLENILLPAIYNKNIKKKEAKEKAFELIKLVGLEERIKHNPNQLSGGQQQRVAIARALINSPEIVLADEPTGNLDSKSSEDIMNIFEKLNLSGVTLVIVTHEQAISDRTKRKIFLKDGEIINDTIQQ